MSKNMSKKLVGTMAEAMDEYLEWNESLWKDSPVSYYDIDQELMIKHNIYDGLDPEIIAQLPQLYGPRYFFDKEKAVLVWRAYCLYRKTLEMHECYKSRLTAVCQCLGSARAEINGTNIVVDYGGDRKERYDFCQSEMQRLSKDLYLEFDTEMYHDELQVRMGWMTLIVEVLTVVCESNHWQFEAGTEEFRIIFPESNLDSGSISSLAQSFAKPDFYSMWSFKELMELVYYGF